MGPTPSHISWRSAHNLRKKRTIRNTIMKIVRALAIAVALLVYGTVAVAADSTSRGIKRDAPKGITTTFYRCIDRASSDTVALGTCLSAEKKTQDTRLNITYDALLGKLHGKAKDGLVNAERAWLEFHNKSGDFEASLYGDETVADFQVMQNEIFSLCKRADALGKYLSIANDQ